MGLLPDVELSRPLWALSQRHGPCDPVYIEKSEAFKLPGQDSSRKELGDMDEGSIRTKHFFEQGRVEPASCLNQEIKLISCCGWSSTCTGESEEQCKYFWDWSLTVYCSRGDLTYSGYCIFLVDLPWSIKDSEPLGTLNDHESTVGGAARIHPKTYSMTEPTIESVSIGTRSH